MNSWLTTHWPPYTVDPPDWVAEGVWVPDGCEEAARDLEVNDEVFIYHPRSGRTLIKTRVDGSEFLLNCQVGRQGIVAIGKATESIHSLPDAVPERYTDGTETLWRWHARITLLSRSGFVSREDVNRALGFKPRYNFRGLGEYHSGLKKLDPNQANQLREQFRSSVITDTSTSRPVLGGPPFGGGGESLAHLDLKQYVAANPSKVLDEPGVMTFAVEQEFSTGDRADVVLRDRYGRMIGVEIELDIPAGDLTGPLQAIKYRRMLEMATRIRHGDGRAVLIAHAIPVDVKNACKQYEVLCVEVDRSDVLEWRRTAGDWQYVR